MNSTKKALLKLIAVGIVLAGLSGLIPLSGSNFFCQQDKEFKLYNDVKRGVPFVYYKSSQQCGDLACKFKPGDPCQSDLKVLHTDIRPLNFVADAGFWALVVFGAKRLIRKGLR